MQIDTQSFTPLLSSVGGALIGLSASMLLLSHGRIAGISGILGGLLTTRQERPNWRLTFVLGLLSGGLILYLIQPAAFQIQIERSAWLVALAGLLVGYGTRLGSGCTSGHGVCGLSRFSKRSLVATLSFMLTGALAAYAVAQLGGQA